MSKKITDYDIENNSEEILANTNRFLAQFSHEIRTPLNMILGMTDMLRDSNPDSTQSKYIKSLTKAGHNLLEIINDVLDFAQVQSGEFLLDKSWIPLTSSLDNLCEVVFEDAKKKEVTFITNCLIDKNILIRTDKKRILQIAGNLLGNAIKYTDKGSVEFTYEILTNQFSDVLKIVVSDTGKGIDKDYHEEIFSEFFQIDTTKTGSGLGLSITDKLVDKLGGEIIVRSLIVGTQFEVYIPVEIKKANISLSDHEFVNHESARPLKVLIAEDDEDNTFVFDLFIKQSIHEVDFVVNGQEAIDAVQAKNYDMVILDLQMPEVDGIQAATLIRRAEKKSGAPNIPLVALTANAYTDQIKLAKISGFNGYMTKPISTESFNGIIDFISILLNTASKPDFNSFKELAYLNIGDTKYVSK